MVVAVGLGGEVFKVYPRDRIQQLLVEHNSLTFQFRVMEVFTVYAQDKFLLLHPRTHLVPWMRLLQGFFSHFSQIQKSARLGPHSGSELAADFTPWTPAACGVPMVPEEDESEPVLEAEFEEEDLDKWVDEFGRSLG